ncbi:MAG: GDP-mannose 4,6-dehydratase [Vicinamibacterales bacterium]
MAILLTGASGFVGAFVQRQITCIAFDYAGQQVDLRDAGQVRSAIEQFRPEGVIHLAGQSFVPASFDDPRETYDINFFGTLNLLDALKESGFRGRMLFVGSGDMYGLVPETRLPITEDLPPRPRSPYAVSKVAAAALCYQWSQTETFALVMTRSFNHIGPGQSERFVVSDFAKQVIEIKKGRRKPILHVGDIDVTRDFTDVRDAAAAYALLLERGGNGEIYNVCSGVERSVRLLLVRLLELANVDACIEQDPTRLRVGEQRRFRGSYDKLRRDTGWEPATSIDQSLRDILQHWEEQLS